MVVVNSIKKNVAIRGLNLELYNEIYSMAKKEGKRVSDLINVAIENYIDTNNNKKDGSNEDEKRFVLRNSGDITLSKGDIVNLRKEVGSFLIENTGHLTFEKDVDKETIKYIQNIIIKDGLVEVTKKLHPQILIKSEIYGKLEKY